MKLKLLLITTLLFVGAAPAMEPEEPQQLFSIADPEESPQATQATIEAAHELFASAIRPIINSRLITKLYNSACVSAMAFKQYAIRTPYRASLSVLLPGISLMTRTAASSLSSNKEQQAKIRYYSTCATLFFGGASALAYSGLLGSSLLDNALADAVVDNDPKMVRYYLNHGVNPNNFEYHDWSLLHYSLYSSPEITELLLQYGANVNIHKKQFTPLMHACQNIRYLKHLEILLHYNPNFNLKNSQEATALGIALSVKNFSALHLLIKYGADPNQVHYENFRPLRSASISNRINSAAFLLAHGADINIQESGNRTSLMRADPDNANLVETNRALAQFLLSQHANKYLTDFYGYTAHDFTHDPEIHRLLDAPEIPPIPESVQLTLCTLAPFCPIQMEKNIDLTSAPELRKITSYFKHENKKKNFLNYLQEREIGKR